MGSSGAGQRYPDADGSAQGMTRQRGFAVLIVYAVIALAALAALGGIYAAGRSAGKDSKQAEWDAANVAAQEKADSDRRQREADARTASKGLQDAQRDATDWRTKWAAERAKPRPLAVCGPAKPVGKPTAVAAATAEPGTPLELRLTYSFARLYDSAWTGQDGQPVFGDPGGSADEAVAASSFSPGEVLDNHAENAARCSTTSRQLNRLIDLIRKLQK